MFLIKVEEAFKITNRKGIVLVGITSFGSGVLTIGDVLVDEGDRAVSYKIIGIESLNYIDKEKTLTHNPAIVIDLDIYEPNNFIGKTFFSE